MSSTPETIIREKIEAGLRDIRKQMKNLSKNELINALLQQLEAYTQLQAASQQLYKENQTLKGMQDDKTSPISE